MLHFIWNPLSNKNAKSKTCRDKPHAPEALKHPSPSPSPSRKSARNSERGNVFFTLFGAVAVVGVLGAGIMQTMQGPLNTMVQVNLRERANTEMSIAARIALLESASNPATAGDCDNDGFVEPLERGGALAGLTGTGAGTLPNEVSTKTDPWGNAYGYCAWDAGITNNDACASNLFDGDGTTSEAYAAIAIISSGPDGVFQTACSDYTGTNPVPPAGDDLVNSTTYGAAIANSGGLWNIKTGSPTSAEIDKNIDLTATSTLLGGASPQLLLGARSLILPTQVETGVACDGANDKILRINTGPTPPVVEICDFDGGAGVGWASVAAGASASSLATGDSSVVVNDTGANGEVEFIIDGSSALTIDDSSIAAGGLNIVTTGTLAAGASTLGATAMTGASSVTGTFDVSGGATTLDALTASGTATLNGALVATAGATIGNSTDPALTVTGDISATDLDISGDLNLENTQAVNWGTASSISGATTAPGPVGSLVFTSDTAEFNGAVTLSNTGTALDVAGDVDIGGDLDISGGSIISSDNTIGHIFVGDGTDMDSVLMSGDTAIAADGSVTIQNDAITAVKILDSVVSEAKLNISNAAGADECLKFISGSLRWDACSGSGGGDGVGASSTLGQLLDNTGGGDGGGEDITNVSSIAIGSSIFSDGSGSGGQLLEVDITGDIGAANYCDADGLNCFTTTDVTNASSDRIEDDDGNTSIDVDTTNDGVTNSIVMTTAGTQRINIGATGIVAVTGSATISTTLGVTGATTLTDDLIVDTTTLFVDASGNNIGMGIAAPNTSAILDMTSTTAGVLTPRMTIAQRDAITTPATGLIVFSTDAGDAGILQFWDGSAWIDVGAGGAEGGGLWTDLGGDRIHYGTAGTEQVGIGTNNPVTTLDVNGGIRVGSVSGAAAPTYMALNSLSDTDVASPTDGQYLVYNNGSGNWEAQSLSGSSVADDSLDWAQFVDTMTLDATTTIDMDTNTANLTFDNADNTLHIDSTNNRIGVGTNSPSTSIHVDGDNPDITLDINSTSADDYGQIDFAIDGTVYSGIGARKNGEQVVLFLDQDNDSVGALKVRSRISSGTTLFYADIAEFNTGIGTETPDASSMLDITSTDAGFLAPRMTTAERDAINSGTFATGLMIYNTDTNLYQFYNGAAWSDIGSGASVTANIDALTDAYNSTNIDHDGDLNATNDDNLVLGHEFPALDGTTPGARNTAIGRTALDAITTGDSNIAIGYNAATAVTTARDSVFIGKGAGLSVTGGHSMILIGSDAAFTTTGSDGLIAIGGNGAGRNGGAFSTIIGYSATARASIPDSVIIGFDAGVDAGGFQNVFIGNSAGASVGGVSNPIQSVFIGDAAGAGITTGDNNIFMGYQSGDATTTGSNNIVLGYDIDTSAATATHELNIGSLIFGNIDDAATGGVDETQFAVGVADAAAIDASAIAEFASTTRGLLAPRMDTTARDAITLPATSLMIFNTTNTEYQFNAGTAGAPNWQPIGSAATCGDTTPDGYNFADNAAATASTLTESDIVQINGLGCAVTIDISGEGSPQYRTCSDGACATVIEDWTTSTTQIGDGEYIQLRLTASAAGGDTHTATALIGNAADAWNVTTTGGDCTVPAPAVGTVCADGTLYAGLSPDGNVKMYASRCDAGQTWSGVACTGVAFDIQWSTGNTINNGFTNDITGFANTYAIDALANADAPYTAVDICANLNQDGHTDWYLPARDELDIVADNRLTIGNFQTTSSPSYYWSSSESTAGNADVVNFFNNTNFTRSKLDTQALRCVRKDGASPPATPPGGNDGEVMFNDGGALAGNASFVWDNTNDRLGVGTGAPDASSILDLTSTTAGFLPPRMTTTERDAINSGTFATGLTIYNTTTSTLQYYDGAAWQNASAAGALAINDLDDGYTDAQNNIFLGHEGGGAVGVDNLQNTGVGIGTLDALTNTGSSGSSGDNNTALGYNAGTAAETTRLSVFVGSSAGLAVTGGHSMIMIGPSAGRLSAGSDGMVVIGGNDAGRSGMPYSVIMGYGAASQTSGNNTDNVIIGNSAGIRAAGDNNVLIGRGTGYGASGTNFNNAVMIGTAAGANILTGFNNIFMGYQAGDLTTTGANNIIMGYDIDASSAAASHELNIGSLIFGNIDDAATGAFNETSVGIGVADATAIDTDALFELDSTTRGLLIPRMTTVQRDAIDNDTGTVGEQVTTGLTIYNITTNTFDFYNGAAWSSFATSAGSATTLQDADPDTSINVDTAGDGTDNTIVFTNNSAETMRITAAGNVGIGEAAPGNALTVAGDIRGDSLILNGQAGDAPTYIDSATNLDWDDLVNAMTLDTSTSIDMDTNTANLNFDSDTFVIRSNTNRVGIGTGTPNTSLDIIGTAANGDFVVDIQNTTTSGEFINLIADDSNSSMTFNQLGDGAGAIYLKDNLGANVITFSGTDGSNGAPSVSMSLGATAADSSAILHIASATKGFLPPRMTTAERDAINSGTFATGLMVYNTTTNTLQYYDGAAWQNASAAGALNIDDLGDATTDYTTDFNMFMGSGAGASITTGGQYNIAIGQNAGDALTVADGNIAIGYDALTANINASNMIAIGQGALDAYNADATVNATRDSIIAIGTNALGSATDGRNSVAIGALALSGWNGSIGSSDNTAVGYTGLLHLGSGASNTALGASAGVQVTSGSNNTFIGRSAGGGIAFGQTNVNDNVFIGGGAGGSLETNASRNTALGYLAGSTAAGNGIGAGTDNILIGYQIDVSANDASNELNIGNTIFGDMTNAADDGTGTAFIGINNNAPSAALDVTGSIEYSGVMTDVSDRRLKDNIEPLNIRGNLLDRINQIETVSFVMKDDASKTTEFGVIAQQIETIFPELVKTANDEMGSKSVNYIGLIAPMIEATKELKTENDTLRTELAAMKSDQTEITATLAAMKEDMAGMKMHTGFGMEKANIQTLALMILMMLLGGACVMITTRIKRQS